MKHTTSIQTVVKLGFIRSFVFELEMDEIHSHAKKAIKSVTPLVKTKQKNKKNVRRRKRLLTK